MEPFSDIVHTVRNPSQAPFITQYPFLPRNLVLVSNCQNVQDNQIGQWTSMKMFCVMVLRQDVL